MKALRPVSHKLHHCELTHRLIHTLWMSLEEWRDHIHVFKTVFRRWWILIRGQ